MALPLSRFAVFAAFSAIVSLPALAVPAEAEPAEPAEPAEAQSAAPPAANAIRLILRNPVDDRVRASAVDVLEGRATRPAAGPEPARPGAAASQLADLPFHDEVLAAALTSGLDPALIHAVIRVESNHRAAAASPKGAIGLMQLMPDTARRYGVRNSKDPAENIRGGVRYLIDLQRLFDNDLELVLAAYNAGENAVLRYGRSIPRYAETRSYVPRVLAEYDRLRKLLRSPSPRS